MEWNYKTAGIPDEMFIRGTVPMTKEEVRVLTLSKLRLHESSTVLDIGCGTGSISVEAALQCPKGQVISIDMEQEAVELTKENQDRFAIGNMEVYKGYAPADLPDQLFDRICIGGTQGKWEEITAYCFSHLKEEGVVVANTILLNSTYGILKAFENHGLVDIDCTCVNIAKGHQKTGWMMKANNPVYILSAKKKKEQR